MGAVARTQDGILARCTPDGRDAVGLSAPIDDSPRPRTSREFHKRAQPRRTTLAPSPVARHVAWVEWRGQAGSVLLIDVLTGAKRPVPALGGRPRRVVVEPQ